MPKLMGVIYMVALTLLLSQEAGYGQELPPGDKSSGYMLRYGLKQGRVWRYNDVKKKDTELQIPQIGMDLGTQSTLQKNYSIHFISQDTNSHLKMAILVHDISLVSQSGSGEEQIDFSDVKGKEFYLIVTDAGREIKYAGIENLKGKVKARSGKTVNIGIENFFYSLLLDLPEKKINLGDVWKTNKSNTIVNEEGVEQTVIYETLWTFEALAKIDDSVCLKINRCGSGTLTGAGTGSNAVSDNYSEFYGELESFGTVYFDPEEGVVRKAEITNVIRGEVTIRSYIGQYKEPFKTIETIETTLAQQPFTK